MQEHNATIETAAAGQGRGAGGHATGAHGHAKAHGHGKWHFARHYLEMVVAMFAGMLVFGGIVRGALALTGADYTMERYPEIMTLEMAFTMALGMLLWMRFRGHGWAGALEMSGVMFVPAIVLFPLLWSGALDAGGLMAWEHVLMFPLMLLVMVRRRAEFGL